MSLVGKDMDLVEKYLNGDKETHRQVEKCLDSAFGNWRGRLDGDRDDIKSDVRIKLLRSLKDPNFVLSSGLLQYVRQVANHTCIDYYRANKRWSVKEIEEFELPYHEASAEDLMEKAQSLKISLRVWRLASEECRQIWTMVLREGLNYDEIAGRVGKTEGYIKWRIHKCREAARHDLEALEKKDKLL